MHGSCNLVRKCKCFSAIGMDLIDSCYSFDWGRFFVGEIINIKEIRHIDRLIVGTKS